MPKKYKFRINLCFFTSALFTLLNYPVRMSVTTANKYPASQRNILVYLTKLAEDKMLRKDKLGTGNYYINEELFDLLTKR